jgi:hypothetical protein
MIVGSRRVPTRNIKQLKVRVRVRQSSGASSADRNPATQYVGNKTSITGPMRELVDLNRGKCHFSSRRTVRHHFRRRARLQTSLPPTLQPCLIRCEARRQGTRWDDSR